MIQNKSIIIIGAGPVGLAAAIELRRRGATPRIIDSAAAPNPNSRALLVNARTLDLLRPAGLDEQLIAAGNRVEQLVIRREAKVLGTLDLRTIPHRCNFLLILPQAETERILAQHLASLGLTVERNTALTSLTPGTPTRLTLSTGETCSADVVIGADGAHSTLRKALGLTFPGLTDEATFGLADVTLNAWPYPGSTAVMTLMADHIAPFLPFGANHGRFITTTPDCLAHLPADAKINKVEWVSDFHLNYRQAETYQQGACFIIGDAAHIHSPVGGRGMNLGIEDACWLAYLLAEGREAEFTALRHPVGASVLKYTEAFTAFAKRRGPWQELALRAVLAAANSLPPLRNRLFNALTALNTPAPPWL